MHIIRQLWMRGGLAGAVFIMCIMLNSFGFERARRNSQNLADACRDGKILAAGGIIFPGFRES